MGRKRRKSGKRTAAGRRSPPGQRRSLSGGTVPVRGRAAAATRSRILLMVIGAAVLLTGVVAFRAFAGFSPSPSPGPTAPLLASTEGQAQGEPVDGSSCQQ